MPCEDIAEMILANRFAAIPGVLLLVCPLTVCAQDGPWDYVLENETLVGEELDVRNKRNVLIRNCSITDSPRHGIFLKNVESAWIENTTITGAAEEGIDLSSAGSCANVTIVNNHISNVGYNGIHSSQPPGQDASFHPGLTILGNEIHNTGNSTNPLATGKLHGIYLQSSEYLVEANRIYDSNNGHGISVRSSGIVRGNVVWDSSKACIRYYSDHPAGGDGQVLIENNVCDEDELSRNYLVSASPGDSQFLADSVIIRFNTVVARGQGYHNITIDQALASKQVEVYGNLLVNLQGSNFVTGPVDLQTANYTTNSTAGFVDGSPPPNDLHLSNQDNPAVGFASDLDECPSVDMDGDPRTCPGELDCGADQLAQSTPEDAGTMDSGATDSDDCQSCDASSEDKRPGEYDTGPGGCSCHAAPGYGFFPLALLLPWLRRFFRADRRWRKA